MFYSFTRGKILPDTSQVKVLRSMKPLQVENVVIGQYKSHIKDGVSYPAYIDDRPYQKTALLQHLQPLLFS